MGETAVTYGRVSSAPQLERASLGDQGLSAEEYAARHGLTIVKHFEGAESAKEAGRAIFGEMVAFVRRNKIRHVLVYDASRLSRNLTDLGPVELLVKGGVTFHATVGSPPPLGPRSRSGDWTMWTLGVGMAHGENLERSFRARESSLRKAQRGLWPTRPPVGYLPARWLDPRASKDAPMVLDPERWHLVAEVFGRYATGRYSQAEIRKWIKGVGLTRCPPRDRPRRRRPLSLRAVEDLLRNPIYRGEVVWQALGETVIIPGLHPAIVTDQVWYACQQVRERKTRKRPGLPGRGGTYSGLLRCGACARALSPTHPKGLTYYSDPGRGPCNRWSIPEPELEGRLSEAFRSLWLDDDEAALLLELAGLQVEQRDSLRQTQDRAYRKAIDESRQLLTGLTLRFAAGEIEASEYQPARDSLKAKVSEMEARLSQDEALKDDLETSLRAALDIARGASWALPRLPGELREPLVRFLVGPGKKPIQVDPATKALEVPFREPFASLSARTPEEAHECGLLEELGTRGLQVLETRRANRKNSPEQGGSAAPHEGKRRRVVPTGYSANLADSVPEVPPILLPALDLIRSAGLGVS